MKKSAGPMTMQSLLIMIQIFEMTDSFHVQSGRGKKRIYSMVVDEVATAVRQETSGGEISCSSRGISWTLE